MAETERERFKRSFQEVVSREGVCERERGVRNDSHAISKEYNNSNNHKRSHHNNHRENTTTLERAITAALHLPHTSSKSYSVIMLCICALLNNGKKGQKSFPSFPAIVFRAPNAARFNVGPLSPDPLCGRWRSVSSM